ncbi:MAG: LysM peptidoglycan-binding domain-containing protein [Clostridia bacterium]
MNNQKRKLTIALGTMLIFLTTGLLTQPNQEQPDQEQPDQIPTTYTSIEVEYGDTLWSISRAICTEKTDKNIDLMVDEIIRVNGLKSDRIVSGNYLIVPNR